MFDDDETDSSWEGESSDLEPTALHETRSDEGAPNHHVSLTSSSSLTSNQSESDLSASSALSSGSDEEMENSPSRGARIIPSRRRHPLVRRSTRLAGPSIQTGDENVATGITMPPYGRDNLEPSIQQESISPLNSYWRFWSLRADPINRLKDIMIQVPYRGPTSQGSESLAIDLSNLSFEEESINEARIDGIPESRILLVQFIESIFAVL